MGGLATGSIVLYQPPKALIEVFISSSGGAEGDDESKPKAIAKRLFEDAPASTTRTAALLVPFRLTLSWVILHLSAKEWAPDAIIRTEFSFKSDAVVEIGEDEVVKALTCSMQSSTSVVVKARAAVRSRRMRMAWCLNFVWAISGFSRGWWNECIRLILMFMRDGFHFSS